MSALLREQRVELACKGELVVLKMGNVELSIEFPLALQIATVMKHEARMAKLYAGIQWRTTTALGTLHDAAAEKPKRKRFMEVLPERLNAKDVDIRAQGQMVMVRFGHIKAGLPFAAAETISQWIRLRGKEAKRNAGELAHWSSIARATAVSHGERPWH